MRAFIGFVEGKNPTKPSMAKNYNTDSDSGGWIIPVVKEVMERSQKLSENIFQAEKEIQNLEAFLNKKVLINLVLDLEFCQSINLSYCFKQ